VKTKGLQALQERGARIQALNRKAENSNKFAQYFKSKALKLLPSIVPKYQNLVNGGNSGKIPYNIRLTQYFYLSLNKFLPCLHNLEHFSFNFSLLKGLSCDAVSILPRFI
jgi:hypothetical protein